MSDSPLVSVLIPCYNAEAWVRQSVESALNQTYPNKEVIVVDDGSTDGSLAALREFGNSIQLETGPNRGGNAARNRLLALSRGKWLSYLDADDYLLPDKIKRQVEFILVNPNLDVVYSPFIIRVESEGSERENPIPEKNDVVANYLSWGPFSTNSVLLRRASIAEIGGWKESQKVCQEHELLARMLINGCQFGLLDIAGSVYRFHGSHTVSFKSRDATIRQRMLLTDRMADYLATTGQLSGKRRGMVARARFEAARSMYRVDRAYARKLMRQAIASGPIPSSPAAPRSYRVAQRLLGFDMAEQIARIKRALVPDPNKVYRQDQS